jgi:hypothetical protein
MMPDKQKWDARPGFLFIHLDMPVATYPDHHCDHTTVFLSVKYFPKKKCFVRYLWFSTVQLAKKGQVMFMFMRSSLLKDFRTLFVHYFRTSVIRYLDFTLSTYRSLGLGLNNRLGSEKRRWTRDISDALEHEMHFYPTYFVNTHYSVLNRLAVHFIPCW